LKEEKKKFKKDNERGVKFECDYNWEIPFQNALCPPDDKYPDVDNSRCQPEQQHEWMTLMKDLADLDIFSIYGEYWGTKLEAYCDATKV